MSHIITPNPVLHTTYTVPDDGDPRNAASVNLPFQQLGETGAFLALNIAPLVRVAPFLPYMIQKSPSSYAVAPSAITGRFSDSWDHNDTTPANAPLVGLTGIDQISEVTTGAATSTIYAMRLGPDILSHGRALSKVELAVHPVGGHSALPADMPAIAVWRVLWDDSASPVSLFSAGTNGWSIDPSGNTTAYQIAHAITLTPDQNQSIDHTQYLYVLLYQDECSTHALAGNAVHGVRLTHQ